MNKLSTFLILILFISANLWGQTPIDVAETTMKINGLGGEEIIYYGFSAGDQLIFNYEEVNGKELKEIEIIEFPSSSKFMDYKSKKIENKVLTITRTGIYKFRFTNTAVGGRICKVKIQRIPENESTKNFNTSVYWRTVTDTTYVPKQEVYLAKSDTIAQEIYSSTPQISSSNALNGNKNLQVIDFMLPTNTISWSFYIGTGKEGKEEYDRARDEFAKTLASSAVQIPYYGPMVALALTGVSYFNKVQGEDNVKYWFISDASNVALFESRQTFMQYKKGDVVNEASQMKMPLSGKVYLGLMNDNTMEPITVIIKVTAIVVNHELKTRTVKEMIVNKREEPYLK